MFLKVTKEFLKKNRIPVYKTYYRVTSGWLMRGDRAIEPNVIVNPNNIYVNLANLSKLGSLFYGGEQ